MRAPSISTLLMVATVLTVSSPAFAQTDPFALAEKAAQEAEKAAAAALEAARAARTAADALKAARASSPISRATAPGQPIPEAVPQRTTLDPSDTDRRLAEAKLAGQLSRSVANGPNESLLKTTAAPDVQFTVSEKEKVVSVAMSFNRSITTSSKVLQAEQFTLSGSGELDDDGERSLAGLKGFTSGTDVSLSYTRFRTPVRWSVGERAQVVAAREICLQKRREAQRGKPAEPDAAKADLAACDPYTYADGGAGAFTALYNPAGYAMLIDDVLPGPIRFHGLKVTGNESSYKYLDRTTFKEEKDSEFGYSASLFGGVLFAKGQTAVTGSLTYKRDYEAADAITLCQPVAATSFTQCITSADSKPSSKDSSIVAVELRHAFPAPLGTFSRLAIAPEISADVENDAYSVVLPLYFGGDDAGKLRAGVRAAYVNQKDEKNGGREEDFSLGLFIGAPFSLLPN